MGNFDETFMFAIILLLGAILMTARLIALKTNHDPIAKRYKPGTYDYNTYKHFLDSRRFSVMLAISILAIPLSTAYIVYGVRTLVHENTPPAHYMLIFGPTASIAVFVFSLVVAYNMLIKNR